MDKLCVWCCAMLCCRRAPVQHLDMSGRAGLLRTVLEAQETRGLTRSDDISRLLPAGEPIHSMIQCSNCGGGSQTLAPALGKPRAHEGALKGHLLVYPSLSGRM